MIGQTVLIRDISIIQTLYPNFKVLREVSFMNKFDSVIYIGKAKNGLKEFLEANTKEFICTVGAFDIDLSTREHVYEYLVHNYKLKPLGVKQLALLEPLDDVEFYNLMKLYYINKRLPSTYNGVKVSLYTLYKALCEGQRRAIDVYMQLCQVYPPRVIESSLLTFLDRVINLKVSDVKPSYSLLIKNTNQVIGSRIKDAILTYSKSSRSSMDLLFLVLTLSSTY